MIDTNSTESNFRTMRMSRSVYEGMKAHAAEMFPREAVGLLGGVGGCASRRIGLCNVLGSKRFLADPFEQFQALRQFSAAGLQPLAVYHSHPGGGSGLSADDLFYAAQLPYLQLVIAIGRPHNPEVEIAGYEIVAGSAKEIGLEIVRT